MADTIPWLSLVAGKGGGIGWVRIAKDPSFETFRTLDDAFGFDFSPFKQPSQN